MFLAILTFLTGVAISAIAIYYSVIGLAAIFSAAVIPIIVMGTILEVSKLVSAWWLKANWYRAPFLLKSYMLIAVIVLMLITSMGIFGFLSKAHTDQAITTGDVTSQVALYDEQINVERENIANAKSLISQMDATVQGIIANGESREIKLRDGRTYQRSAAEQALQVRRSQAKDRAALTKTIEEAQANILELQKKKAPIAAEQRKVEAEVGPIKYIAKLIYGDNPDQNILEKAVTWVIITIVFVFDPLAVLLLLASQMSFGWAREQKEEEPKYEKDDGPLTDDQLFQINEQSKVVSKDPTPPGWMFESKPHHPDTHPYLKKGFAQPEGWPSVGPIVSKPEPVEEKKNETQDENSQEEDTAVSEAIKWAEEQRLNRLRDEVLKYGYSEENDTVRVRNKNYTREEFNELMGSSYVQNEEQTESGTWSKINSKISEEEYLEKSATKRSRKKKNDNSDNAS